MTEVVSRTQGQTEDAQQVRTGLLEDSCLTIRPRLLQLARLCGVPEHSLEDIVQETFLSAWLHLDQLRDPERLCAWLEGICRNQCRMFLRRRQELLLTSDEPLPFDPFEDVERRELLTLLGQAMERLSREAREILFLCDLAEEPQQEAALRLGVSVQTLRVRLHRARQQLRRVLGGRMRSALSAYGFALDPDVLDEWRETALWCRVCGQQRLRGILECDEQSGPRVRLRCPDCSPPGEQDMFRFMPPPTQPLLSGRRTLGPALKYTQRYLRDTVNPFVLQALTTNEQRCPHCHQPVRAHLHGLDAPQHPHIQVVLTCTACGLHFSIWAGDLACSLSTNRVIEQFLATSARWIAEPDTLVVQADGPACCFRLTEVERGTRLTVLAHKETLQVLTAYVEEAVET